MFVIFVLMVYFILFLNFILFFFEIKGGGVYCGKVLYCEYYFFNGIKIFLKGDSWLILFVLVCIYIYGNVGWNCLCGVW